MRTRGPRVFLFTNERKTNPWIPDQAGDDRRGIEDPGSFCQRLTLQWWVIAGVVAALGVSAFPRPAFPQSATPGSIIVLEEMVVEGRRLDGESLAREKLEALPGGTGLIADRALTAKTNLSIADALASMPGVIVQNFLGATITRAFRCGGPACSKRPRSAAS